MFKNKHYNTSNNCKVKNKSIIFVNSTLQIGKNILLYKYLRNTSNF